MMRKDTVLFRFVFFILVRKKLPSFSCQLDTAGVTWEENFNWGSDWFGGWEGFPCLLIDVGTPNALWVVPSLEGRTGLYKKDGLWTSKHHPLFLLYFFGCEIHSLVRGNAVWNSMLDYQSSSYLEFLPQLPQWWTVTWHCKLKWFHSSPALLLVRVFLSQKQK